MLKKLITKFVNASRKTLFVPFWAIFGSKTFFQNILALQCTTSYGFLTLFQNLEKTNDPIPRKRPD